MNEKKEKTTDSQNSAFVSNVATGFSVTQGTQAVDSQNFPMKWFQANLMKCIIHRLLHVFNHMKGTFHK